MKNMKEFLILHFDEKYEGIFDRIKYLILLKSNSSDVYSHKRTKKIEYYGSF